MDGKSSFLTVTLLTTKPLIFLLLPFLANEGDVFMPRNVLFFSQNAFGGRAPPKPAKVARHRLRNPSSATELNRAYSNIFTANMESRNRSHCLLV